MRDFMALVLGNGSRWWRENGVLVKRPPTDHWNEASLCETIKAQAWIDRERVRRLSGDTLTDDQVARIIAIVDEVKP